MADQRSHSYLIARGEDLVVLGIRFVGFTLQADDPPTLKATSSEPRVVVTFPPQHIAEEVGPTPPGGGWTALDGRLEPGQTIAAVANKDMGVVQLFAIGDDGQLGWRSGEPGAAWQTLPGRSFVRNAPLAAVTRVGGIVEVFAVTADGVLVTASVGSGVDLTWTDLASGCAPLTAVTALSRGPDDMDVFIARQGACLHMWRGTNGMYGTHPMGGSFADGSTICAVSLDHARVDVFATNATTGAVDWAYWLNGQPWTDWRSLGSPGSVPLAPGTPVAATARSKDFAEAEPTQSLDLFVVGGDGRVHLNWWRATTPDDWRTFGGDWEALGGEFAPDTPLTAVTIEGEPHAIDLTAIDTGGRARGASWDGTGWSTDRCGRWVTLGEWFAPGSRLSAAVFDWLPTWFVVGSDRVVRSLDWHGVPADCTTAPGLSGPFFADFGRRQSRLASPSHVVYEVNHETEIKLSSEGILAALSAGRIVGDETELSGDHTAIEISWRLAISPESAVHGNVKSRHAAGPAQSPDGALALWRTQLRTVLGSAEGDPADARLALRPVDGDLAGAADPGFDIPLTQSDRQHLFQEGRSRPAPARRLELSSVGGSLSVKADWGTFLWEHESVLGRDQKVLVVSQGVLYPFGHRAQLLEVTQRDFDGRATQSIAALRKRYVLTVREPIRGPPVGDEELSRAFPFDDVEITTTNFELEQPVYTDFERPTPQGAALQDAIIHLLEAILKAETTALEAIVGRPGATLEDIAPATIDEWRGKYQQVDDYLQLLDEREFLRGLERGEPFEPVPLYCWPRTTDGRIAQFQVRCGGLQMSIPMIYVNDLQLEAFSVVPAFHSLSDDGVAHALDSEYGTAGEVALPGVALELIRVPGGSGDVHEVHALSIVGVPHEGGFRPRLGRRQTDPAPAEPGFAIALPALRTLLDHTDAVPMAFRRDYLDRGISEDIVFEVIGKNIDVNFTGRADRSGGLVAPSWQANHISRALGPVNMDAIRSGLAPEKVFGLDATLLGFPLQKIIGELKAPPAIVSDLVTGQPPKVTMTWSQVPVKTLEPLMAGPDTKLDLTMTSSLAGSVTDCTLTDFSFKLPARDPLLELKFASMAFHQEAQRPPTLAVAGVEMNFLGKLRLLQDLGDLVDFGKAGPTVDASATEITATYTLPVPDVPAAAVQLRNVVLRAGISVPFDGRPVTVTLAFASRENPFNLSVLMFGGGGYIVMQLDNSGLSQLEASLEFGASIAVDFLRPLAAGEVHALGGIRYFQDSSGPQLEGFLRIGGSVEVLGLVSVSIEMLIKFEYDFDQNELFGRATIIVEIDLTLYSDSVELDSGPWTIAGGSGHDDAGVAAGGGRRSVGPAPSGLEAWQTYRAAFAS